MLVHVVNPSAYTPPYDHALCRALALGGASVELYTSRFDYGPLPAAEGYARRELFYRVSHGRPIGRSRSTPARAVKLAEHLPDMWRYRRLAQAADIVHFQWLTVQPVDLHLLPAAGGRRRSRRSGRAQAGPRLVLTSHDILPREPRPGQRRAQRRLYERFDAVVVHSEHGRQRLTGELGIDADRVHVIPHGVLRPWEGLPDGALPPSFGGAPGPVVLFFGLLRPYKGLDVLLEAWRLLQESLRPRTAEGAEAEGAEAAGAEAAGAELWIAGMPRMDTSGLRGAAPRMRLLERFVDAGEIHALLERASVVVLPYRDIDASGAAFTAIGAGVPLLLSDVGGFPELAASGAAHTVPAGDPQALAGALHRLLAEPAELASMAARAEELAQGPYAWESVAARTLELYRELLAR